ncbi:MAG TPA: flagellar motor switch protein FliM [Fimbriimonadaceae bacterium]|nr:flagellar motor switch protein FliM [Fimbriimonadaceae bacterium]
MSEILSQEEIASLLNAAEQASDEMPAPQQAEPNASRASGLRSRTRAPIAYELYDFRRPDKFSKEQLRTLQMLHETFARLAGSSLSAYLRTPVNIDLISIEQVPFEEYLRSISQSVFNILSLPPLSGQAVLELEFGIAFTMVDRMLGGPGRAISRSVLTDVERPLVRQLVERLFAGLKSAWEGVVVADPTIEGMETSAQFVQIAPPNDIVVTILFEVRIGDQRGAMSLCIPYLLLKPITTKLSAQKWFATGPRRANHSTRNQITSHISSARVECAIRLGEARMRTREVLGLKVGDIVRLDQGATDPVCLYVGNVPKFEGRPALQGSKLVFAISHPVSN